MKLLVVSHSSPGGADWRRVCVLVDLAKETCGSRVNLAVGYELRISHLDTPGAAEQN